MGQGVSGSDGGQPDGGVCVLYAKRCYASAVNVSEVVATCRAPDLEFRNVFGEFFGGFLAFCEGCL